MDTVKTEPPATKAQAFEALTKDKRISHGAFRMWHFIFHYTNGGRADGFPAQRTIAGGIGCKPRSLKPWTLELMQAGWIAVSCGGELLTIERVEASAPKDSKRGRNYVYRLLNGCGEVLPKRASVEAQKDGSLLRGPNGQRSDAPMGNGLMPKRATDPMPLQRSGGERNKLKVGISEGATKAKEPVGRMDVPEFAPLSRTMFLDEYRDLLSACERKISELRLDAANVLRSEQLTPEAAVDIAWLEDQSVKRPEQAEAIQSEAAALRAKASSYRSLGFKPEAKAALAAWKARAAEIEAALLGVKS